MEKTLSNIQISRTLAQNAVRMENPKKIVSNEAMQEEWNLISAAQVNPAAFRPLYDTYFEQIFRFIFRRTADRDLSGDICAQVFLKALQKLKSYQFKGVPFSAWLYRIASNEIAQYYRDKKKNKVVCIETTQLIDIIDEIETTNNEHYRKALILAIDSLKEQEIQLIEMRFFEQRPFKEIAGIMKITESNAKVKTYRTLEKLKKSIIKIVNSNSNDGESNKHGGRAPEL